MQWLGVLSSRRRADREAIKPRIREVGGELQGSRPP